MANPYVFYKGEEELILEREDLKKGVNVNILAFFMAVYCVVLCWLIVFKCNDMERLCVEYQPYRTIWEHFLDGNVPFQSLIRAWEKQDSEVLIALLNFLLFVPLGVLFPVFIGGKRSVFLLFAIALGVEILQLFTGWGGYDVTDVILTFAGGIFGVVIETGVIRLLTPRRLNTLLLCLGVTLLPIAVFAVINTALHFPPIGITELF